MGDTVVLVTAVAQDRADPGARFLPPDRQLHREDLCRGPHSRRLLQARGAPDREGDAHLASHRSPDPAAVPGRLPQRRAGGRHRAVDGPRDRRGHPGAARRLGGAGALGHPVQRADRRRPRRLEGRQVPPQPDRQGSRRVAAAPGGRRHRACRADGRVRGQGPVRGGHARVGGVRPRADAGRDPRHQGARRRRPASRAGTWAAAGRQRRPQQRRVAARPGRHRPGLQRSPRSSSVTRASARSRPSC